MPGPATCASCRTAWSARWHWRASIKSSNDDLPEKIRDFKATRVVVDSDDPADLPTLEEVEKRYIQRVLESVGNNKTLAAQTLGLDRRTLYRKLERYGVVDAETAAALAADKVASA